MGGSRETGVSTFETLPWVVAVKTAGSDHGWGPVEELFRARKRPRTAGAVRRFLFLLFRARKSSSGRRFSSIFH